MKTYRRAHDNAAQTADNAVQACSINVIPLGGANAETTKREASAVKLRPALQAVALSHDLIAERAQAIWRKRGCRPGQAEQNWHEAESQLRAELGVE
jgi:hypothetical protein